MTEHLKSPFSHCLDELLSAMSIYLSRLHYHYSIYTYGVEKMKIMRNNNNELRHASPLVDLSCEDLYCPDVESCVDLIEKYHAGVKECYLEHLDTPLLSSRESHIEISIEELHVKSVFWKEFLDHTSKYESCRWLRTRIFQSECMSIHCTEILEKAYTRDLRDILK